MPSKEGNRSHNKNHLSILRYKFPTTQASSYGGEMIDVSSDQVPQTFIRSATDIQHPPFILQACHAVQALGDLGCLRHTYLHLTTRQKAI